TRDFRTLESGKINGNYRCAINAYFRIYGEQAVPSDIKHGFMWYGKRYAAADFRPRKHPHHFARIRIDFRELPTSRVGQKHSSGRRIHGNRGGIDRERRDAT